jgi:hypothetical protein
MWSRGGIMKRRLQGFLLGFLFAGILLISFPALAETISVLINSVKVTVNGQQTRINTLTYNGITYMRLTDICASLGKKYTVTIPNKSIDISSPLEEQSMIKYSDGAKYVGEILNSLPNGKGVHIWPDNSYYAGTFLNGTFQGLGYVIYPDGGLYFGEWGNGEENGKGYLQDINGAAYYIAISNGVIIKSAQLTPAETYSDNTTIDANQANASINYPIYLYSDEDKRVYLGKLTTDKYDSESVFNEYGTYGSKYDALSIWNDYGLYGGKYSSYSAFNKYALSPPFIVDSEGYLVGRVTTNSFLEGAINPNELYNVLKVLGQ